MSRSKAGRRAQESGLHAEHFGIVRIDGDRHSLVWLYDSGRSVSVLVDRQGIGAETVERLIGAFWPDEGHRAVKALVVDYEKRYLERPQAERFHFRPVDASDLAPARRRP